MSAIGHTPIRQPRGGDRLGSSSVFANDAWWPDSQLTVNIGARFDRSDGTDRSGAEAVTDSNVTKLRSLTNLRAVQDPEASTGWRIELGPFPGWKNVPTW